jgi:hypothetical protein
MEKRNLVEQAGTQGLSLGPSIFVQQLSIRTSQSIVLNLTPVLRNIKLLTL